MHQIEEISSIKIQPAFFIGDDPVKIARELIGKTLVSDINGQLTKGIIVETEAYRGVNDKACHANNGKMTKRNEVMYGEGGQAYVYLCYGIHHLFNIVTNRKDKADAVLVRALQAVEGEAYMKERFTSRRRLLLNGPGVLTKAMGITTAFSGESLMGNTVWLEEGICGFPPDEIVVSRRIGIDYAEEDAELPWRFYWKGNENVSKILAND
ncbi:MAG: DNA-3-methyladenine glycosylase [Cyclobacteriaceae bacterium]